MSEQGARRTSATEVVHAILGSSGRPLRVGELVGALRCNGYTRNPGGLLLRMVAEGALLMDDDRRLFLPDALMVA